MASGAANTVPLVTPYKMGKFDLSHRSPPCFVVGPIPNFLIPYQQTKGFWLVSPRSGSFGIRLSCELRNRGLHVCVVKAAKVALLFPN